MSLLGKKWIIKNASSTLTLTEKLLHNRNLKTEEEVEHFLNPDPSKHFHDPFLMRDMEKAVIRITKAIQQKERILVFGDYDVDGITGSAILIHTLRKLFAKHHGEPPGKTPDTVSYRLPHRVKDGYGLREKFVREFAKLNVKVLITVDNGISAFHEISLAESFGINVIVTDHHTLPETLPQAFALLHPALPGDTYPFQGLTGAGVAFKLAKAIILKNFPREEHDALIFPLLDLACMGTIADLGPLRGENRIITKFGLKVLEETRWPGLSRLKTHAGINGKISTREVGYFLSPRLNAAGRIAHPHYALQLLLGEQNEMTEKLASHLNRLNEKRQRMVEESLEVALRGGAQQKNDDQKILICHHPNWHAGIIGLIAAKLVETYGMPSIAMEDRGDSLVGSCRSISSCNVVEAVRQAKPYLLTYGGHAQAAGFELKKEYLQKFIGILQAYARRAWKDEDFSPELALECELQPHEISLETLGLLEFFEPFGIENEKPKFLFKNAVMERKRLCGNENRHLQFQLRVSDRIFRGIGFHLGPYVSKIPEGTPVDLAVELERNIWNGKESVELKLLDVSS